MRRTRAEERWKCAFANTKPQVPSKIPFHMQQGAGVIFSSVGSHGGSMRGVSRFIWLMAFEFLTWSFLTSL
jgi:hypothetical protein